MYELRKLFPNAWVRENMIPAREYHPYPKAEERSFWEGLVPELRDHLLEKGEKYLNFEWKGLPATYLLEYQRSGDRACCEDLSFEKRMALGSLVMAECVENKGRFMDDIINGIWSICEESTWAISAHLYVSCKTADCLPDSLNDAILDLFSLETAQLIAFSYYLLRNQLDAVSPQIAKRIQGELKRRVFDPYLTETEFWWMGFMGGQVNNWAPWCTSSVLWTFTLACENDQYRAAAVNKAIETLDIFVNSYGEDGACVEGPGYWYRAAGSLMDALEIISDATRNQVKLKGEKLKRMGQFICNARICDKYYMNFADSPLISVPESARIFRYGKTMQDPVMMAEGAALKKLWGTPVHYASWYSMGRVFSEILCYDEMKQYNEEPLCQEKVWWSDAQIMIARETSQRDFGYTLIAKGGHNGESHNHNDIGSFILFEDGKPVIIDIGVERYTAKTFSPQRYEIWTMRSGYHNVPQIGGAEQLPGEEFGAQQVAYQTEQGISRLSMELGSAYGAEAGICSWNRTLLLDCNQSRVQICDQYDLQQEQVLEFHFMTQEKPEIQETGVKIGSSTLQISGAKPEMSVETIDVEDKNLQKNWGNVLYRITVTTRGQKGEICFEIRR